MPNLPALSVDVEARIEKFTAGMQAVGVLADNQIARIEQNFRNANPGIDKWFNDAKIAVDSFGVALGGLAVGFVAFKLLSAVIGEARDQLKEMVEIADRAQNLNISPSFLQGFETEARKLQVDVKDLDGALSAAFQATKEKSPIDLSQWETAGERITEVEKALRVYNETVAKAAGTQLQGLVLFRDAQDQQTKVLAVLQAMKQLEEMGHKLESLDLGEKMFGAKFVDNIRLGKTSADSLLQSLEAASRDSQSLFSDEVVQRAKEIDDKLKQASDHLSRELKPNWESVANVLNDVKSLYADIVDLGAKIVNFANNNPLQQWASEYIQYLIPIVNLLKIYRNIQGSSEAEGPPAPNGPLKLTVNPDSRGAGAAPTKKETDTSEARDQYDRMTESISKQTAALDSEARTVGMSAEAKAQDRAETLLWNAAIEAGRAPTDALIDEVGRLAEEYGKAAARADAAQREFRAINSAMQFAGNEMISIIDGIATKSMTATDALKQLQRALLNAILQSVILGSGPLAGIMGTASTTAGGTGGLFGALASALPGRAGGGPVNSGMPYIVGEQRPELFVPDTAGRIMPLGGGGGAGGVSVVINNMAGADVSVQPQQRADGGISLEVVINRAVKNAMQADLANYGPVSQSLARRFNLNGAGGLA